jgi:hypothetical protein
MKIQIFTSVVNRPDFVEIQNNLFKKFLKNDYQFHIIDDSVDSDISEKFKNICEQNNLVYYKKPERQGSMSPGQACADAIQWTFDTIIKEEYSDQIVLFCDSDMFLIDEFDIEEYMEDVVIAGLPQYRGHVTYMWNGIMFFDMSKVMFFTKFSVFFKRRFVRRII